MATSATPGIWAAELAENMEFGILEIPVERFEPEGDRSGFGVDGFAGVKDHVPVGLAVDQIYTDFGGFAFDSRLHQGAERLHIEVMGMFPGYRSSGSFRSEIMIKCGMEYRFDLGCGHRCGNQRQKNKMKNPAHDTAPAIHLS